MQVQVACCSLVGFIVWQQSTRIASRPFGISLTAEPKRKGALLRVDEAGTQLDGGPAIARVEATAPQCEHQIQANRLVGRSSMKLQLWLRARATRHHWKVIRFGAPRILTALTIFPALEYVCNVLPGSFLSGFG